MANERPDFRALKAIPDPLNPGRSAYQPGEYLYMQVVDDWRLQIGVDVAALRPESLERPSGNADRETWANYRLAQGMPAADVDAMGRNELRDADDPPPLEDSAAAAAAEEPAEGDAPEQEA